MRQNRRRRSLAAARPVHRQRAERSFAAARVAWVRFVKVLALEERLCG